jgi:DNA-binding CsgD family transcriptional regulator
LHCWLPIAHALAIPTRIAAFFAFAKRRPADAYLAGRGLSDREIEVVQLCIAGASRAEIAQKLAISPETVKKHVVSLYRKTGTRTRFGLLHQYYASRAPSPPVATLRGFSLSAREREIADRMRDGLDNGAIATDLFISVGTVRRHVRTIYAKTGVHSRLEFLNLFYRRDRD